MELMFVFWLIVSSHQYLSQSGEDHRTEYYYNDDIYSIILYHSKEECIKHRPPDTKKDGDVTEYDCEPFSVPAIEVIGAAKLIKNLPNSLD